MRLGSLLALASFLLQASTMNLSLLLLGDLAFLAPLAAGQFNTAPLGKLGRTMDRKIIRKPTRNPTQKRTRKPTQKRTRKPTKKRTRKPTGPSSKPSKKNGKGGTVSSSGLNKVILTLRNIADPFNVIAPNSDLTLDLDGDGSITFQDVLLQVEALLDSGALALEDLFPAENMTDYVLENYVPNNNDSNGRLLDEERQSTNTADMVDSPFHPRRLQQQSCGVSGGSYNGYTKGSAPAGVPQRKFTQDFVFGSTQPGWWDFLNFAFIKVLFFATQVLIEESGRSLDALVVLLASRYPPLVGVPILLEAMRYVAKEFFIGQEEGLVGFRHYLGNSGTDITVDYDKAIREDGGIKSAVDAEVRDAKDAVRALRVSGSETSFQFHKTTTRGVSSTTVNWKGALGEHVLWSTGTATYDESECQVEIALEIFAEDLYDFNRDAKDKSPLVVIASNIFGQFTVYGFASPFMTTSKVSRMEAYELQCCQDTDCGQADAFECVCNLCEVQCPTTQVSGGQGFTSFTVDLKKKTGTFPVSYDMYTIPDGLNVFYEGKNIYSTEGLVSGKGGKAVTYGSNTTSSTSVTVEVNAPLDDTAWELAVGCPP